MYPNHPLAQFERDFQEWIKLETMQSRDSTRINEVVARFWPALLLFATRLLRSTKFRHLGLNASDVVNAWYLAMRQHGFQAYDRKRPFFAFAVFTLYRTCQNIRRYEHYRRTRTSRNEHMTPEDRPDSAAQKRETAVHVRTAVAQLTNNEREAITRKYVEGEPSAAIAPDLGMNEKQFNRFTWGIRKKLRNKLRDDSLPDCA